MKKVWFRFIFVFCAVLAIGAVKSVSAADGTIRVSTVDPDENGQASVVVSVSDDVVAMALSFSIEFDPDTLEYQNRSISNSQFALTFNDSQKANGKLNIVLDSADNVSSIGDLISLSFKVKENAPGGLSEIKPVFDDATRIDGEGMPVDFVLVTVSGGVKIPSTETPEPTTETPTVTLTATTVPTDTPDGTIQVSTVDPDENGQASVVVSLSDDVVVMALSFSIEFDPYALEYQNSSLLNSQFAMTFNDTQKANGKLSIVLDSADNVSSIGDLISLSFKVKENAQDGLSEVKAIFGDATKLGGDGMPVDFVLDTVSGGVKIPSSETPEPTTETPTFTPTATTVPTDTPTFTPTTTIVPTDTPTAIPTATEVPTDTPTFMPTATMVPTDTPTPTPTATETPTETPTFTPTATEVPTDTPTFTPTATEVPTDTPTFTPTATPVPTDTLTPTPTATEFPTDTPTPTPTATIVPTDTPTAIPTATEVPTDTPTPTPTETEVPTDTPTFTPTATEVPTDTPTFTPTATEVPTDTPTPTPTATEVPTDTPTFTPTATEVPTNTPTATEVPTDTPTPTPTATEVPTDTPTFTPTATTVPTDTPTPTPVLISVKVTFKVVNGAWNDGEIADKEVTLSGYDADSLTLSAGQIPAAGNVPNAGYEAGAWNQTPDTTTAIAQDTVYTYTYAEKEAVNYNVTVNTNGYGTASATPLSGTTGTTVTLMVDTIAAGYQFKEWQVVSGGVTITGNTFAIQDADVEIMAVFEPIPEEKDMRLNVQIVNIQGNGSRGVPADVIPFTASLRFVLSGNGLASVSDPVAVTFYGGLTNVTLEDVRFSKELPNLGTPPYKVDLVGMPNYVSGSGIMALLTGSVSGYRLSSSGWIQSNGTIIIYIIWEGGSTGTEEEEVVVRALPEDEIGAYKLNSDGTKEYLLFHTYDICMQWMGSDELCRGPERCFHKENPYVNPFVQP